MQRYTIIEKIKNKCYNQRHGHTGKPDIGA